jgi:alpha-1,2-mannosyltransferase
VAEQGAGRVAGLRAWLGGGGVARRLAWRVPAVLALWAAVWVFLRYAAERHGFFDLRVYYGAINFWAHGRGELYDYLQVGTEYGFTYPPFAALTMLPMAVVPWPVAIVISVTFTVAASLAVLYWLVEPMIKRHGWSRWFTLAIVAALAAAFEPMRETVNFGQVNMLLVFLVAADLLFAVRPNRRFAGVGIGLATAIKLTPGLFILYLLITRRFRAAAVAAGTAAAATVFAAAVIPDASRIFWTDALWNTSRIGTQSFISNQSLNGFVARLDPVEPSRPLWLALALVAFAVWVWRVRRARALGDEVGGFALTAIAGCLLSPITWVHHLVWVLPAVVLLFDHGLDPARPVRQRRWLLAFAIGVYVLLCSRLVWRFAFHFTDWGLLGANAYVWASVILLVTLPLRPVPAPGAAAPAGEGSAEGVPDDRQLDALPAGTVEGERAGGTVGDEATPLVEAPGGLVRVEHP